MKTSIFTDRYQNTGMLPLPGGGGGGLGVGGLGGSTWVIKTKFMYKNWFVYQYSHSL